jgi:hypothetical protein
MKKAIALVALSLALEAGFLFQIATPAPLKVDRSGAEAATVARAPVAPPARG